MPLPASMIIPPNSQFGSWLSRHAPARLLRGAIIVALTIGVAAACGLYSMQNANIKRSVGWVEHTHEVIKALDDVLLDADDAETGQRGFLLTGQASYLEPFQNGLASIQGHLAKAQELTRDNARQQDRLQVLRGLLRARLLVAARSVELAQKGDREQAIGILDQVTASA